ncbi:MAG: hypothetical protein BWY74_04353 [Firmicutes bacterium ADurb.Bin419]|nr:MAG: hypothetical protein BWY74_04353 [Firmicutes bacterium ADurb.Bin419]
MLKLQEIITYMLLEHGDQIGLTIVHGQEEIVQLDL